MDDDNFLSRWGIYGEFEICGNSFKGDFDFQRWTLDVRKYWRLDPEQFLKLRLRVGSGDRELPLQRKFYLGGIGTLSGYDYKEFQGDKMVLGNAEYSIGNTGDASLSVFFGVGYALPYGVDPSLDDLVYEGGAGITVGDDLSVRWAMPLSDKSREGRWELRFGKSF